MNLDLQEKIETLNQDEQEEVNKKITEAIDKLLEIEYIVGEDEELDKIKARLDEKRSS